ncbi:MAG: ribonuclease HII [Bacteroidales bacterium]|jgi:ribonuclease HII|nr:ribonuclease HII [Bacteroidales bacterium]MDD4214207.1 ribonuclease HII [Bacteroidales bacterium]
MLKLFFKRNIMEAGCDEAGRGALAGPVFAAAVILPRKYKNNILNDSKLLSEKQRNELRIEIENIALAWAVARVDNTIIDKINILKASVKAMHMALDKLTMTPKLILVDGNYFDDYKNIPHNCIIKGDGKYMSIAAASVLAKTHRDEFMIKIHKEFPIYNWEQNKGYPTREHKNAINLHGITPYHRRTYNLNEQLRIIF